MKELSIEQKAIWYDEAIERAKNFIENGDEGERTIAESIFAGLMEESEDERIRKEIVDFICWATDRGSITREQREKSNSWLAWLEKQSKKVEPIESFNSEFERQISQLIASIINKEHEYTEAFVKWTSDALLNYAKHEIDKQGEQKPILNFNANDWYVSKTDSKIHNMHHLVDKVEPKFKIGDWIVRNDGKDCFSDGSYVVQITDIIGISRNRYKLSNGCFLLEPFSDTYRLWTIEDAKDGDILLSPSLPGGSKESPFIFKEIDKNGIVRFHAALLQSETLKVADGITNVMGYAKAGYHIPATKEQRDFLFQKMKEAGYEWDAKKKELKRIKQEPTESPKDYHSIDPHFGISVEDLMAKKNTDDKVEPRYNIGDVLCDKSYTTLNKNSQPNIEILDIRDGMYICNNCTFPISQQDEYELVAKRVKLTQQVTKKSDQDTWSEEEEKNIERIIDTILCAKSIKNGIPKALYTDEILDELVDWLKFLKDRVGCEADCITTKEWSEEDAKTLAKMMFAFKTMVLPSADECNSFIEFLKSIRDKGSLQSTWKPSKEQIIALRWILNNIPYCSHKEEISGLLEQIKDL